MTKITLEQAAQMLCLTSPRTVANHVSAGNLKAYRIRTTGGRIHRVLVEEEDVKRLWDSWQELTPEEAELAAARASVQKRRSVRVR